MKKLFAFLPCLLLAAALHAQTVEANNESAPPPDVTKFISFKELDHDFGKIPYGKPAEFMLEMKNISTDSVKIQDVKVGCGCTTPKWQAGPYAPGETFKIGIGFNGATDGDFHKVVTVYFEGGYSQVIKFHGTTFKAPDNAAPGNSALDKMKGGNGN